MKRAGKVAEKAWEALEEQCDESCPGCPLEHISDCGCWLLNNGFPKSRPRVHTVAEMAKQIIKGRNINTLASWIMGNAETAECPGCKGEVYRERRAVCESCGSVYPAGKWTAGEPCECGGMNAQYVGRYSTSWAGHLEFGQCETPSCRWNNDYRPLTVRDLADAAQVVADEQWAAARTCPACGEASGNDQKDGVYLPIERCGCGWILTTHPHV
jgi:hypothetical protein